MATKKFQFLKKDALKTAAPTLMRAGIRGGAAVGSMWLAKKVSTPNDDGKVLLKEKMVGPALLLLGLAGEVFLGDENLRAIAEGVTVAGFMRTTADVVIPDKKAELGLSGLGVTDSSLPGDVAKVDWDKLIEEARAAGSGGDIEEESMNGAGAEEGAEAEMAGASVAELM